MLGDDLYPGEVICKKYGGNEKQYLFEMGRYHGILPASAKKKQG